jgi:predicted dehydrogenase
MSADKIRYGVLGLGRSGWGIHVAALRPREDAQIVAVVDPLEERRKEAADEFGCKTYTSVDDLLKQDDIDVVVVATPSVTHKDDTIKSLRAGKHVACEKPMAVNLAEADEMIRVAEETGKQLFVHHNYRFRPEFQHIKQTIDSGLIGDVFHMRMYNAAMVQRYDWQTLAKNGGGVLNNTCSHYIDMLLQLLAPAKITEVFSDMKQIISAGDVEDHVKVLMRGDNGCTIDVEVSTAQQTDPPQARWIISGTCGTITSVNGTESTVHYFDPKQVERKQAIDGPVMSRTYENQPLPMQTKVVKQEDAKSVGDFYDSLTATLQRGEPMYVTPQSVRETMRVLGLVRKGTKFEAN